MRLLFDENVHNKVVEHFASKHKHEVTKVSSVIRGAPDFKVAELAINMMLCWLLKTRTLETFSF